MAVAFWARVLLPQVLGQDLPLSANQKPPSSKPVTKLGPTGTGTALAYMREVLEKNTHIGPKPQMVRLGPIEGDSKGYWALRAIATPLLSEAKCGIDIEVRLHRHPVHWVSRLHEQVLIAALGVDRGNFDRQGSKVEVDMLLTA